MQLDDWVTYTTSQVVNSIERRGMLSTNYLLHIIEDIKLLYSRKLINQMLQRVGFIHGILASRGVAISSLKQLDTKD